MKRYITITGLSLAVLVLSVTLFMVNKKNTQACAVEAKHRAFHSGTLNAITQCEIGHFEVMLSDDKLEGWFVGGGTDTGRSVRVNAERIELSVFLNDGTCKELEMTAAPLGLAGEKKGDCSHFEGTAGWLNGAKSFQATGKVFFKSKWQPLIIQYPEGYDRD